MWSDRTQLLSCLLFILQCTVWPGCARVCSVLHCKSDKTHQRYGKRGVDSQCVRLEKSKITMNVFLDVVFVVVVMMNHITHRYQRRWDLPGGRWPVFSGSISAVARSNRSRQQQSCPESWYSNVRTDNWGKLWNARDLEIGKVDVWRNQVDRYEDKTDLRVEGFSR